MEKIQKNIIIWSLIFNSIAVIIFFIFYIFFNNQNENSSNNIEINTVKIIKNSEIIKNNENPKWIFNENEININKNILSWIFISKNILLTASHWVNNTSSEYEIIDTIWWRNYSWKLIFKDNENDFAKIEIENDFNNFKNIKIWNKIEIWEEIFSIWFDEKSSFSKTMTWKILNIEWNKIKTDIVFNEWNSGWPIYNKKNELIWIALEVDIKNNVWYFLKINELLK